MNEKGRGGQGEGQMWDGVREHGRENGEWGKREG